MVLKRKQTICYQTTSVDSAIQQKTENNINKINICYPYLYVTMSFSDVI